MPLLGSKNSLNTLTKFGKVGSFAAPILVVVFWLPKWESNLSTKRNRKSWATPFLVAVSGFPFFFELMPCALEAQTVIKTFCLR